MKKYLFILALCAIVPMQAMRQLGKVRTAAILMQQKNEFCTTPKLWLYEATRVFHEHTPVQNIERKIEALHREVSELQQQNEEIIATQKRMESSQKFIHGLVIFIMFQISILHWLKE